MPAGRGARRQALGPQDTFLSGKVTRSATITTTWHVTCLHISKRRTHGRSEDQRHNMTPGRVQPRRTAATSFAAGVHRALAATAAVTIILASPDRAVQADEGYRGVAARAWRNAVGTFSEDLRRARGDSSCATHIPPRAGRVPPDRDGALGLGSTFGLRAVAHAYRRSHESADSPVAPPRRTSRRACRRLDGRLSQRGVPWSEPRRRHRLAHGGVGRHRTNARAAEMRPPQR